MVALSKDSSRPAVPNVFIAEQPSVIVAHPMGGNGAPLGLERPLPLLGGGYRLAPGGMPSTLGIDHVPGLRHFIAEACRHRALSGRGGYHQPPIALVGQNGVGKGFVAHWIARNAGVPLFRMPVGHDFGASHAVHDVEQTLPPVPMVAMAAARCANPVIVVELDVDKPIAAEVEETLISMIDPRTNSRWIDDGRQTILDLSHVSWIVEVQGRRLHSSGVRKPNEVRPIEAVLPDRLETTIRDSGAVFRLDAPRQLEELRILDVAIDICAASMVSDPDVLASVLADIREIDGPSFDYVGCDEIVRTAKWSLSRHSADEHLG